MDEIFYYSDRKVATFCTKEISEKLPNNLINLMFDMAFLRGETCKSQGISADYLQVFYIKMTSKKTYVCMVQEEPQRVDMFVCRNENECPLIEGKVYLIEESNGGDGVENHYITMLFPEEY